MFKNQKGFTVVEMLVVIIVFAGGFGWVNNIITIANSSFDTITGLLVIRVIGIFVVPLGCVIGYI